MYGKAQMKTNYHIHTTWCDGKDTPEEVVLAAISKGFDEVGFSSHAMLPGDMLEWPLTSRNIESYAAEIRSLKEKYSGKIKILCGVEADFIPNCAIPDRSVYKAVNPDYIIGSVHFVVAQDGTILAVDKSPDDLVNGIKCHYSGSAESFVRSYFTQVREMVLNYDFDIIGHLDLPRKFNKVKPVFDESSSWYYEELIKTADAVAESGKIVEVNTGAIARNWFDDAYPSPEFRELLRERSVRFILGSDAHSAEGIDCAFDRFASAESFLVRL